MQMETDNSKGYLESFMSQVIDSDANDKIIKVLFSNKTQLNINGELFG